MEEGRRRGSVREDVLPEMCEEGRELAEEVLEHPLGTDELREAKMEVGGHLLSCPTCWSAFRGDAA